MNVTGIPIAFWLDFKTTLQEEIQEHVAGEDIGPRGEPMTLILLNGHSIKILTRISVPIDKCRSVPLCGVTLRSE